jgi:hypothetical protein
MTVALLITSPIGGRLSNVVGSKVPLVIGSIVTTVAFVVLAVADERWEIYLASTLVGTGVGFAFASMTNLIVEAVPPGQTGDDRLPHNERRRVLPEPRAAGLCLSREGYWRMDERGGRNDRPRGHCRSRDPRPAQQGLAGTDGS